MSASSGAGSEGDMEFIPVNINGKPAVRLNNTARALIDDYNKLRKKAKKARQKEKRAREQRARDERKLSSVNAPKPSKKGKEMKKKGPEEAQSGKKNGFEKGYTVDSIIGVAEKDSGKGFNFLVKWKSEDLMDGDEEVELLDSDLVKDKATMAVLLYYESLVRVSPAEEEERCDSEDDIDDNN